MVRRAVIQSQPRGLFCIQYLKESLSSYVFVPVQVAGYYQIIGYYHDANMNTEVVKLLMQTELDLS